MMSVRTLRPLKVPLPFMALMIASLAVALLFVVPTLKAVTLPAPGEATEAEAMEVWEQLSAATQRYNYGEAERLAKWLDEWNEAQGNVSPLTYSRIVQQWCEMGGHGYEFCEEEDSAK